MALISIKRNVDLQPGLNAPVVFNCSQGDKGTTIMLGLMNGGNDYTVPSGVTITIRGSRSNGAVFTPTSATFSGSTVSFTLTEEMTDTAGPTLCEAVLEQGNNVLGTANFIINVEGSPMGADVPPVFTDAAWAWMLGKLTTETVPALGDDVISSIQGKVDKSQGSTNAKKFLRVNTSGNVSLASTDKTLSVADQIADAKETGDQIRTLDAEIDDVATTLGGSISTLNGITTDLQSSKLNKNQGASNAGKVLMVNQDGTVSPAAVDLSGKASESTIAPEFDPSGSYTAGSYVYKNGVLYRFTADHSGAWTGSDAETVTVGNELTDLKADLNKDVQSKIDTIEPLNWFNSADVSSGILHKNGEIEANNTRFYTGFIPAKAGDVFKAYYVNSMSTLSIVAVCCYNTKKIVVPSAGTDTISTSFTVPVNVAYVRITLGNYYTSNPWITKNYSPTTSEDYAPYFEPYDEYNTDFLTPETESKINSIPDDMAMVTVKGTNLIPTSDNGVGAYVVQSGRPTLFSSYTTYHYAIVPVKPNTRYFVNYTPSWWILTDDNDSVIGNGTVFTPSTKRFIDTGTATKLYYTVSQSGWNVGLIISEGLTGESKNIQKQGFFTGINQLMFDSWYACALPKNTIRLTKGIAEKFYNRNMLALPDKNVMSLVVSNMQTVEADGVLITPTLSTDFNNYLFAVYDDNLSLVENNTNGQFGQARNDNVQNCSVLLLGDSTIAQGKVGQFLIDAFSERSKTVTLLGTLGTGDNKNEGRAGWSASQYLTNGTYEGATNPFYNPQTESFDFSYYMTNQSYNSVDFVVIQLGINDLYNVDLSDAKARIDKLCGDMFTIITSIKTFNPDQKIILNLPTPCTSDISKIAPATQRFIMAKFVFYNAMMMVLSTNFSNTRCSNCHLILDGATDIFDTIHPNNTGYNKMALEVLSQINVFQNA